MSRRRILLTGCSGGGKTTLMAALAAQGIATVPEPGRRIVAEEQARGGCALPWIDLAAFARRAWAMAIEDFERAGPALTLFDRGIVDAAVALDHAHGTNTWRNLAGSYRYDDPVLLVPPWPDIYAADEDRRHGLVEAMAEYDRLHHALHALGHEIVTLRRASVADRVLQVRSALRG